MGLTIQFLGGAGTVTGSRYLIDDGERRVLVDCGLFQGIKELRLQNWQPFPVGPSSIDAVVLTHAHLDHTGYLPLLVKNGFGGHIFCSRPTRDLSKIILADSARLQEEDAAFANEKGFTRHSPARPLYTETDAHEAMKRFVTIEQGQWNEILPGWSVRMRRSGHILGSTFIELRAGGKLLVFSGDLGRSEPLVLCPPETIERADYLLIESTYGDRVHERTPALKSLARIINETIARRGRVLIPSFAVGRTQDVLYLLLALRRQNRIPDVPIFLDSPMGIDATEIFAEYPAWHRLTSDEMAGIRQITTLVRSQQQSRELLRRRDPEIVIAGSGMLSGGRILHHLAARLPDARNSVVIVGFQAAGTRGRLLLGGIPELKIHGEYVPVRARIESISGLSAHADQAEILAWLRHFQAPPKRTFIVHGEPQASDALRVRVRDELGWETSIPKPLERFEL